ncbi:MAG: carboxy terminal-processing peptidase [Labilithrix sp.]|nr:carboxy terminal-processing peptidase [Labilithrix sp.]MCW5813066.1 carboxy terminal-processing peptidase [Labilithrix sp.]
MRRSLLLLLVLALSCGSPRPADKRDGTAPPPSATASARPVDADLAEAPRDPREPLLASAAGTLLGQQHVRAHAIDDAISKEAFQRFIEELDSGKLFLLESDVQRLARFETVMDDELRAGDLALGRKGVALLTGRRRVVADVIARTLAAPLDFSANETIETDPKKRAFCKTEEELAARWRGVLKLQVLERAQQLEDILERKANPKPGDKPADADDARREAAAEKALGEIPATFEGRRDKVQKEIATRYATQFVRLATADKLEPAQTFINALNAVYDPHTNYLPPAEEADFDIAMTGRLEGIGATLREQDHYILVNDLVPGGAAEQQGKLEIGDLILAVAQEGKEPVDVTDMPIGKVVSMIRGPKGTVVILTVKKPDDSIKTISITRDVVRIEATYARGAVLKTKANGDVGYVHLPGFYGEGGRPKPGERNATADMRALLTQLTKKGVKSLVFDLRGNGGGLLTHARDISGLFIKEGPVVQTKDGSGAVEVLRDTDASIAFDGPVVVLVDRFCASAAEIVAGALQDYERAVVVGSSATHGKGTVQAVLDLDRTVKQPPQADPLGVYKITVQEYFRVSGGSTQLKGIVPDVLLPDPTSFVESGERTLFHAIPWSTIAPASFTKVPHAWKTAALASASAARTGANADLATVTKFAKLMEARRDKTMRPLARDAWQAEYKRMKSELDALDPKKNEPKPLLEVVPLTAQDAPAADPRAQKRVDKWKDSLARDLWVDETTRILADMMKAR